jgi:hypothetical protein
VKINMESYIDSRETALVGPENGSKLLEKLKRDNIIFSELEGQNETIEIAIPNRIISMNGSYFLAAWGERVRALGREKFKEKYKFITTPHIDRKIARHIETALKSFSQADVLNVANRLE